MIYYLFIALILAVLLSFRINAYLSANLNFGVYRFLLAPGIIIHELSHAVGCFITGAHIIDLNLLNRTGGEVKHEQSPIPVLGQLVISMAPLITGLIIIFFLLFRIGIQIETSDISFRLGDFMPLLKNTLLLLGQINWLAPLNWLYAYLLISLIVTIAPSKTDLIYALPGLVLILLLGIFLPSIARLIPSELVVRLWLLVIIQFAVFLGLFIINSVGALFKRKK